METCLSIVSTLYVTSGGGRHIFHLIPDQVEAALKYFSINQTFAIMACAFGKTSIALLILRIIGPATIWRKWFLYINMGLYMVISIATCVFGFVRCDPVRALWEPATTAKCWDPKIFVDVSIFSSCAIVSTNDMAYTDSGIAYGVFVDFFLALLPIAIVWNLKMKMKKKVGLCALLGTGVL